ncbi:protein HAPLESS 2 [Aristolochia californica]|uniref:protein HAPLESS 2 n=1 Tax=Aristolochia californica TaxID=171875 RepID=UPI0035E06C3B
MNGQDPPAVGAKGGDVTVREVPMAFMSTMLEWQILKYCSDEDCAGTAVSTLTADLLPKNPKFHFKTEPELIEMKRERGGRRDVVLLLIAIYLLISERVFCVEILSKSKIEKCEKQSGVDKLACKQKIVVNMAVPSGSSGGEASIVAQLVEAEDNATHQMQTIRTPPIININKSAAYALYEITYIRDVPYKPVEYYVRTRKCEADASAKVVKICERLKDQSGHFIESTQPICCPCGPWRRAPSSCGNFFDKLLKGKANTAHCLRFPGDWFHVFGIGRRSLGFNVRIQVKKGAQTSEVIVGPENRTAMSNDNFLRVNLIGDFVGYTSIPSFEDFYLVTPRQGFEGQPHNTGRNFSMWMLLERVRFTLDGIECNKIGVSYEAFSGQPNFCSSPLRSCLHNQLWNFWDADQNRISRNQLPQYRVEGRFERINQHPNAGTHSFSIGITEALNTNLLIELSADDIEYVYQRSPGKILSVTIPTFEALTQFGTATITTKNIGKLEASYSLTFDCSKGVSQMEEQFFIMKPKETARCSFKVYPNTDQAAKFECSAILKDSNFNEIDRAKCQFITTATVLDNGTEIASDIEDRKEGINGFFDAIGGIWKTIWGYFVDFFTGKSCRGKCSSFFDFSCHIQYICLSWIVMFGLFLAIFPAGIILLWLLHQKGLFDPLYDWWEDRFQAGKHRSRVDPKHGKDIQFHQNRHHHKKEVRHPHRRDHEEQRYPDKHNHKLHHHHGHHYHHHHDHKHRYQQDCRKDSDDVWEQYSVNERDRPSRKLKRNALMDEKVYDKVRMKRVVRKGTPKAPRDYEEIEDQLRKRRHGPQ